VITKPKSVPTVALWKRFKISQTLVEARLLMRNFKARQFPAKNLLRFFSDGTEDRTKASALGISPHVVWQWQENNININQWYADKYAVRIGLHPSAVWDDWFELEVEEV
jgi:hypothetical protein